MTGPGTPGRREQGRRPEHQLLVPADISIDHLEALALTRFPQTQRTDARTLRLGAGVVLTGPWQTSDLARGRVPWAELAYLVSAPVQRGAPVPPELQGRGGFLDSFADGEPTGVERTVLDFLDAAARRLGGALEVGEGRGILTPGHNPDLVLYSGVWLEPGALEHVVAPHLPGVSPPPELEPMPEPSPPTESALPEDERRWLHAEADAFDRAALERIQVTSSYGVTAPGPGGSILVVAVEPVAGPAAVPPPVSVRPWAQAGVIAYEIRHHQAPAANADPDAAPQDPGPIIDACARALLDAVGGEVYDDDGFPVLL